MKSLIIFILFVSIPFLSFSQEKKVEVIKHDVKIEMTDSTLTRVYKFSNSRIKRELNFETKSNKYKYC